MAAPEMLDTDRDKGNTERGKGFVNIKKLNTAARETAMRGAVISGRKAAVVARARAGFAEG